jgi:ABC-type antimicrobial peptide transport system permease subunit
LIADYRIRLATTPVPITGQTFGVLLVGGALGLRRGFLAVALYLALGLFLPFYAEGKSGLDEFVMRNVDGSLVYGASAGYLLGFLLAAVDEAARLSALEPNSLSVVAGAVDSALAQVFGLFDALALVAVVVAALGIVNTLTVSVLERVRELGVLRAAGMTRGQVRRSVVVEAGILGIVGSLLGIAAGLVAGTILVLVGGGTPLVIEVPWGSLIVAVLLGVGVSMAAAWYPARLASRLAIVAAVQHE